jgi:peptide/nickel transport system permease protein
MRSILFKLIIRRLLFLFLVIWTASTITFFIPRLSDRNPVRERFAQLARSGGYSPGDMEKIIAAYNAKFGLDRPLWRQYVDYMSGVARFDLGVSYNLYPRTVTELIMDSLPWTITLLLVTTLLSFVIGTLLGAIVAWPPVPHWVRTMATPFILLQGIVPGLMGILLIYLFAFKLKLAPPGGAYSIGFIPDWSSPGFIWDVVHHQLLPGLALLLTSVAGWMISMPGMGISIQGEDYIYFAEHKGLRAHTIFKDYYLRNALLPQATSLALALGNVVGSGFVVESEFGLPGLGSVLAGAIASNDFLVIYGIVLFTIVAVATLMMLMEFVYPLLDPRIRNE